MAREVKKKKKTHIDKEKAWKCLRARRTSLRIEALEEAIFKIEKSN